MKTIKRFFGLRCFVFLLILVFAMPANAQNTMYLLSGEQIKFGGEKPGEKAQLWNKKEGIVYYSLDGERKTIAAEKLDFAVFTTMVFIPWKRDWKSAKLMVNVEEVHPDCPCTRGTIDGTSQRFNGAFAGGAATGFLIPVGLIGTAIIASTPPSERSIVFPNPELANNDIYRSCLMESAKVEKRKQTWAGGRGGISMAVLVIAVGMAFAIN